MAKKLSNRSVSQTTQQKFQRIYQVVALIPSGQVASYGQVADLAGLPRHARLVSKALKLAPERLNLPWHRVISSQLKIAFPASSPMYIEQKQALLAEQVEFNGSKIQAKHHWQPDLFTLLQQLDY